MNEQKVLNLLGLAMRAGKLVTGEELALKEVRGKKAHLVFVAHDASENTKKKVQDKCRFYEVACSTAFNQTALSIAIGRSRMVISVVDAGFAKKMRELLGE
jgi:ribosomal protein L7Ae-like RNA K-turn-binding protein